MLLTGTLWKREPPDDDRALLARARQGHMDAFEELRARHHRPLAGFVARRVGFDDAEDVTQEVWVACWRALPGFGGRSRFKAWLYGIAEHKCIDYLRSRRRMTRAEQAARIPDGCASDGHAAIETREAVREALGKLPTGQREVVELYYYAELTLAEIAQSLGRNLNTVKYQFYRAHAQVAEDLGRQDGSKP